MPAHRPFETLREARLNDATIHRLMRINTPLEEIVVELANEKAELLSELNRERVARHPLLVMHPDGRITSKSPIHIPNIPPNIPQ